MFNPIEPAHSLLIVTGLSGSGRSFALKTLEDMGYDTVDNLPLFLLQRLLRTHEPSSPPLAIGIDSRTRGFSAEELSKYLEGTKSSPIVPYLIFLDCEDSVLARRYSETRRPHPLAGAYSSLNEAIQKERQIMQPLQEKANLVIDTSLFRPSDFRRVLSGHFEFHGGPRLSIVIASFAYRHGLPREADLVFDARVLTNPYYMENLKPLSGLDAPVQDYIHQDPLFEDFLQTLRYLIHMTLTHCEYEGRHYLTIAIGCTGGRHRSVFMAETLGKWLKKIGQQVQINHTDIDKQKD